MLRNVLMNSSTAVFTLTGVPDLNPTDESVVVLFKISEVLNVSASAVIGEVERILRTSQHPEPRDPVRAKIPRQPPRLGGFIAVEQAGCRVFCTSLAPVSLGSRQP